MLPSTRITKSDGNTGVVKPSSTGVLAIIAASASGTKNAPATFARQADALAQFGLGPLVEGGAYYMQNAGKPFLGIRANAAVAGAYGTIDNSGMTGTLSALAPATSEPLDEYDVWVIFPKGGTVGVAGITYKYSLDGGSSWSPLTALGTALGLSDLLVPVVGTSSGVGFTFGAGTIVDGNFFKCPTSRPQMNNSDLVAALEALRTTRLPWDAVLIDGDASSTTVSTVDSWLAALEATGVFKNAYMNTRMKLLPAPTAESEATYAAAMGTLLASTSTIRVDVGADGGDVPSPVTGLVQRRQASLGVATRAMKFPVGVDPAFVANGSLPGFQVTDANGNPKWHDEALFPGLDDLRLSTLRSFNDEQGVFITNANILSPSGSDYVYDQHARCMNVACTIAFARLTLELSRGVRKQPADKVTGKVYILEQDAAAIETVVTAAMEKALNGQVNATALVLSRTDDLSSNAGATITGSVEVESLAYIKDFAITSKFVKSITVKAGG